MTADSYSIGYSIPNHEDYGLVRLGPALDEAEALKVDCVELPLYAIDLIAAGRVMPERLKRVKEIASGRALFYTAHGPLRLNLMDQPDLLPMHKDVLKAMLEAAAELGARHFVAHCGGHPHAAADTAPRYARQRDILAQMGDIAAQGGMVIAVENLFGGGSEITLQPSRLAREIEAIGHPAIAACLDVSHAYLQSKRIDADFLDEVAALARHARHVHIHDSYGVLAEIHMSHRAERLAYGLGDLHLPAGKGSIPWDGVFRRCRFPAGTVFIHELAPPYWPDLPEAIASMRAMAAKAVFVT